MGTRAEAGRALEPEGPAGQSRLAPGGGAGVSGFAGWQHPGRGRIRSEGPAPFGGRKENVPGRGQAAGRGHGKAPTGVQHWVHDVGWEESIELLMSKPTINIEGLVGGYTGPGGKTILPGRAVAKIDMRLVPDMKAQEALAALKAHLEKKGFGDIEVTMTGGYDPTSTPGDSAMIRAQVAVYKRGGIDPVILPRNAGSWPGYVFTGEPLKLPAGHFGLGHGSGAHAPDEYYVIESKNPKVQGLDGAVLSHVEYLHELAVTS